MESPKIVIKKVLGRVTDVVDDFMDSVEHRSQPRFENQKLSKLPSLKCGHGDGRWIICPEGLTDSSVVYSVGVGHDISFDLDVMRHFGCAVHAFDPTEISKKWLNTQTVPKEFIFHDLGLAHFSGVATFKLPKNHSVSFSLSESVDGDQEHQGKVYTLNDIMQQLDHRRIHLLKIDIEGAEYDIIEDLAKNADRIDQLLIEFHDRLTKKGGNPSEEAIKRLEAAGFQMFNLSRRGLEYTFLSPAFLS